VEEVRLRKKKEIKKYFYLFCTPCIYNNILLPEKIKNAEFSKQQIGTAAE
jgi:hypothetical protein